jgi:hypothetical protein
MDDRMWRVVSEWFLNPTIDRVVTIVAGIILLSLLVRASRRVLLGHIKSADNLEEFWKNSGRVSLASSTFHLVDAPVFKVKSTER